MLKCRSSAAALNAPEIPSNGPFGDDEAELLKFAVDLGGSPTRILTPGAGSTSGPLQWFSAGRRGAAITNANTTANPRDASRRRFRGHDDEDVGLAEPDAAEDGPEEPVQPIQTGAGPFPFENRDLLSEGEDFEGGVASTAKEDADRRQD
jgi:hypothetical protein